MSYFQERCAACSACVKACRSGALKLRGRSVERDSGKCRVCGRCARVCANRAMEIIGKRMEAADIAEQVYRDKAFYDSSGGGATISGGEATMQPEFLLDTLRRLRERGIRTALETCGWFRPEMIPKLCDSAGLFLFDIKHANSALHKKFTGVPNGVILSNFSKLLLCAGADRVIPRIPIIPGFNTDGESVRGFVDFLANANYAGPVHFMPYNALAKSKWQKIGRGGEYGNMGVISQADIDRITDKFREASFNVVCNG